MTTSTLGPDVVIAGTARSGTSALAAQLGTHPEIDACSIKEPNYFSRSHDRGPDWYDGLFQTRREGLLRMDASTSYTSPLYPDALDRLADEAPDAFVVYAVRHPTRRAVSHYLFRHYHFHNEPAADFGAALRSSTRFVDTGDYSRWLPALRERFPAERLLVVPFEVVTESPQAAAAAVHRMSGLTDVQADEERGRTHRNEVVQYRSALARWSARRLRDSALYPKLRTALGADRVRRARDLVTRRATLPTFDEALASCNPGQLTELRALDQRAGAAVSEHLAAQDQRLGLAWEPRSFAAGLSSDARRST
ncbi:MAG: sulfotransferase domain-containing protein [Actinomycetota bacterium]|nr:sulfotransferase domain-containing protein [Actinomycetota bacterium]